MRESTGQGQREQQPQRGEYGQPGQARQDLTGRFETAGRGGDVGQHRRHERDLNERQAESLHEQERQRHDVGGQQQYRQGEQADERRYGQY